MRLERLRARGIGWFKEEVTVDLTAIDARIIAVTGGNGAGKSTLLELFGAGLYRKTATRGTLAELATARDSFIEVDVVSDRFYRLRHTIDAATGGGDSIVLDEDGRPAMGEEKSAKKRKFDAWAALHLPPAEVFYTTTFSAQRSKSKFTKPFLELDDSDRKAVLLRVLGVERLEDLARRARERAAGAKGRLDVLCARLADEETRAIAVADAEAGALQAAQTAVAADAAVEVARVRLVQAEAAVRATAERERANAEIRRRCAEISRELEPARARVADLQARITNNEKILADADAIRAAVRRVAEIPPREQAVATEVQRLDGEKRALAAEAASERRRAADAGKRASEAAARAGRARARLVERPAIESAEAALPGLRETLARADRALAEAERKLEAVRGAVLAGAEDRVGHLRGALGTIADEATESPPILFARCALREDDGRVKEAAEHPVRLNAARKGVDAAQAALQAARAKQHQTAQLAARAGELAAADSELRHAEADAASAGSDAAQAETAARAALESAGRVEKRMGPLAQELAALAVERAAVSARARRAEPLATAEARLAELGPQVQHANAEVHRLERALADVGVCADAAPTVDAGASRDALRRAETGAREAHAQRALADRRIEEARSAAARREALAAERLGLGVELADWSVLAEDLGRDGLQAMEIDAAGPELTVLINDLLHTCVGTRWTVSVETNRLSADGKKLLEGCDVRVIDTERGRDATAESLSGGERVLVGEAIALALSMLACRRAGMEGSTLIRDETGAALEPKHARAYVAMLRRAADLIGAHQVLFVSHAPDVQELADARIVVRDGGVRVAHAGEANEPSDTSVPAEDHAPRLVKTGEPLGFTVAVTAPAAWLR